MKLGLLIRIISLQAARILQLRYDNQREKIDAHNKRSHTTSDDEDSSSSKKQKSNDNQDPETAAISRLGKKFAVMEMIWLRKGRETFSTAIDDEYTAETRFENDARRIQGQIRAIRQSLPNEYWVMLEGGGSARNWLSDTVSVHALLEKSGD